MPASSPLRSYCSAPSSGAQAARLPGRGHGLLDRLRAHHRARPTWVKLFGDPTPSTSAVIEIVAGALLVAVAIAVRVGRVPKWRPRRRPRRKREYSGRRPSLSERVVGKDSLWIAWAAGALYSVPGAYYLAGMALLAKQDTSVVTDVVVVVAFNVIMFALIGLPLLSFRVAHERARAHTEALNDWMTCHKRTLIVVVAGAGGAYLLVSRLIDLP
jgi:hypothetical protein